MYVAADPLPTGISLRPARYSDAWGIYWLLYRHSRDFRPEPIGAHSLTAHSLTTQALHSRAWARGLSSPVLGIALGLMGALVLRSPVLMGGLVTIGAGLLGLYALQWLTLIHDVNHYQVVTLGPHVIGCAKAQAQGQDHTYISNLVISSPFRGQGLGSRLIRHLQAGCRSGQTYLFCLPNRLDFYQRLGFEVVSIDRLPAALYEQMPGLPKQIIAMVYG
jgi:N-acetylglutamate synthase-like GNAT family acetyltransferase